MASVFYPIWKECKTGVKVVRRSIGRQINQHWPKTLFIAVLSGLLWQKDVQIDLQLSGIVPMVAWSDTTIASAWPPEDAVLPAAEVILPTVSAPVSARPVSDPAIGNTYANTTYTNDPAALRAAKRQKQLAYVQRFAPTAQSEMEKFGVPASIILAQGLLESDAGESQLALKNRNHFGIKCFSRTCRKGHCSNFTDDSHKDFFRIYKSDWESYRAHSHLLRADRYRHLFKLSRKNYRDWAIGLKKAGYATDPGYGEKLIRLIEDLELQQYD
ncbi:MAG TPA: glucosaminidase domain-containing protein [Saprospiraceae bacterium]|nr:glucosaminidase domain-containing protein [Saprospiraceae bacterium]HMP23857.1 glucosaminidase domain-containing protein [Saprospiraceae bacterium]